MEENVRTHFRMENELNFTIKTENSIKSFARCWENSAASIRFQINKNSMNKTTVYKYSLSQTEN